MVLKADTNEVVVPANPSLGLKTNQIYDNDDINSSFTTLVNDKDTLFMAMIGYLHKGIVNNTKDSAKIMRYIGNYNPDDSQQKELLQKVKRNRFKKLIEQNYYDLVTKPEIKEDYNIAVGNIFGEEMLDAIQKLDLTVERICDSDYVSSKLEAFTLPTETQTDDLEISKDIEVFLRKIQNNTPLIYPEFLEDSIEITKTEDNINYIIFDAIKYFDAIFEKIFSSTYYKDIEYTATELMQNEEVRYYFRNDFNVKVLETERKQRVLPNKIIPLVSVDTSFDDKGKVKKITLNDFLNNEKNVNVTENYAKILSYQNESEELSKSKIKKYIIDGSNPIGNLLRSFITPIDSSIAIGKIKLEIKTPKGFINIGKDEDTSETFALEEYLSDTDLDAKSIAQDAYRIFKLILQADKVIEELDLDALEDLIVVEDNENVEISEEEDTILTLMNTLLPFQDGLNIENFFDVRANKMIEKLLSKTTQIYKNNLPDYEKYLQLIEYFEKLSGYSASNFGYIERFYSDKEQEEMINFVEQNDDSEEEFIQTFIKDLDLEDTTKKLITMKYIDKNKNVLVLDAKTVGDKESVGRPFKISRKRALTQGKRKVADYRGVKFEKKDIQTLKKLELNFNRLKRLAMEK
tara:strand:- start:42 stop:1937 length:1896 start_codon:yes stop_codon:yes gene_type:complete